MSISLREHRSRDVKGYVIYMEFVRIYFSRVVICYQHSFYPRFLFCVFFPLVIY